MLFSEHKTYLVVKDSEITILHQYQNYIRPLITSQKEVYFLLSAAGNKLTHLNVLFKRLGNHASISIPSPTIARKIGVTEHARQGCSYSEAANLSHHMGHSLKVSHKYCKATVAAKTASAPMSASSLLVKEPKNQSNHTSAVHGQRYRLLSSPRICMLPSRQVWRFRLLRPGNS